MLTVFHVNDPVLTSMHCAQHWPSAAINVMFIIPQALGKQCKPQSPENHNKNGGTQCILANTGSTMTLIMVDQKEQSCCEGE